MLIQQERKLTIADVTAQLEELQGLKDAHMLQDFKDEKQALAKKVRVLEDEVASLQWKLKACQEEKQQLEISENKRKSLLRSRVQELIYSGSSSLFRPIERPPSNPEMQTFNQSRNLHSREATATVTLASPQYNPMPSSTQTKDNSISRSLEVESKAIKDEFSDLEEVCG